MNALRRLWPLAALTFLSGCVYFNTFYNARKQFDDADRKRRETETRSDRSRRSQAYKKLYMNAIRKASIVLDRHPDSKWVDDALLLIGKAFYWREIHDEAVLKFQELAENFPESDLVEEAYYWRGLALRAEGRIDGARDIFVEIGSVEGGRFTKEARISLAELESDQENYQAAIDAYKQLLSEYEKEKKLKAKIWSGIGNAAFNQQRYDEAAAAYEQVLKSGPDIGTDYLTRLRLGRTLELQHRFQEALEVYGKILKIKRFRSYEGDVRLRQANVHTSMEAFETAERIYAQITKNLPHTEHSAFAYYEMGLIALQHRKDHASAKEHFQMAKREKSGSEAAGLVRMREKLLSDLKRYEKASQKKGEKGIEASFNLAELYLFGLSEPDSAVAVYDRVLKAADTSDAAPKALYALGLVYADTLKDDTAARRYFGQLVERYPASPFAVSARKRILEEGTQEAEAQARFHQAEALRQDGATLEEAMAFFRQIAADFPNTLYAAKAIYVLAWSYENERNTPDLARAQYQRLIDRYPMSEFSEVAREKLKGGFLDVEAPAGDSAGVSDAAERSAD